MTEPSNEPQRQVSPQRKNLYYGGMVLIIIGFLLFFSTFVTGCANFGNFENFEGKARSEMARAFGGMALLIAGGILMNIGARGAAGSGLLLDPEKARKDVEPWARMAGGITSDALSEVEPVQRVVEHITNEKGETKPVVKVRCPKCRALNDETAKFCNQCGAPL
jgi:hypothetical protein